MRTKIYLLLSFIALAIIIQSSSCSKTDEPQTHCDSSNTAYIPSDARSRFFFKEGTYWVYKNLATGEIDTLTVIYEGYEIGSVPRKIYGDGFSKCYEGYVFNIISKIYNKVNIKISVDWPTMGNNTKGEVYTCRELFTDKNFVTTSFARFKWKGENRDSLAEGYIDSIQSLKVNNILYYDVIHYFYKSGFENTDYLNEAWYANKIGLVKVIRKDGTTWELINSNIIQ